MQPPVCAAPDRHPHKPGFDLPSRATDCHAHVFNPKGASGLDPKRSYSPSIATEAQYNALHDTLGIERGVIVQPSVYGTDNTTTMDVVSRHPDRLRAVVVVDQDIDRDSLLKLHEQGARGARINLLFGSSALLDNIRQLAWTLRSLDLGWHLQLLADVSTLDNPYEFVKALDIDVVFDHLGHMPVKKGTADPGFQALLRLLDEGRCWVKLSGAYRISASRRAPYPDVDYVVHTLLAHNPEQLVWGSDWPHPSFDGDMPNDGVLLNELFRWVPDVTVRHRILVDNAARLYGFDR